jgi:hypothetical protein
MVLQPSVRPRPLFQFRNPIDVRQDSLDGGSARRKADPYTQDRTNTDKRTETTDIHVSDRAAAVIDNIRLTVLQSIGHYRH